MLNLRVTYLKAMKNTKLRCKDLQGGDIMLKLKDNTIFSKMIFYSQTLIGALNSEVSHVGIMRDQTYIIEAAPTGIEEHDTSIRQGAATAAELLRDIPKENNTITYNYKRLLISATGNFISTSTKSANEMEAIYEQIINLGKTRQMICSQLVVYKSMGCYSKRHAS